MKLTRRNGEMLTRYFLERDVSVGGILEVGGKVVDVPVVGRAKRIVSQAEQIKQK